MDFSLWRKIGFWNPEQKKWFYKMSVNLYPALLSKPVNIIWRNLNQIRFVGQHIRAKNIF